MTDNNKRDWFKIFDVSANVLGTIGTIAIAAIGFWFTALRYLLWFDRGA
ncbi:MAG: hypothetical protein IM486_18145 [Microcystis sp. M114S2]|jgi:hypothetical protein|nr:MULTISPECIES: hypothetical protein [unclassified Microcystis]MCA2841266.1 hypothetical protein [Microcystis sp. M079S1]MCA2667110.1 hypothetical protein [Microcystis sp. M045S2]MCA2805885.1 hypothetical protein [Microcystis sp. M114S2]MCA2834543.1 hypothetical protein [Microcystis sp. M007S1]MCA2846423.1 hypothetical protein [Microcystis sp. M074S1]